MRDFCERLAATAPISLWAIALLGALALAASCAEDGDSSPTTSPTGGHATGGTGAVGGTGVTGGHATGGAGASGATGATGGGGAADGCTGGAEPIDPNAYYVATSGDDSNPGTETLPWRTIQQAASTLGAGETVYIRAGTYPEQVTVASSGTADAYITFAAYPGEAVVLDGTDVAMSPDEPLFNVGGQSYVKIRGLAIQSSGGHGIGDGYSSADNGHIVVERCSTYRTQHSGVHFFIAHDITVDCVYVDTPNLDPDQEAITFHGVDQFEIRNCTIIRQQKEGIDTKAGCSNGKIRNNTILEPNLAYEPGAMAIYVDAWDSFCSDIEIDDNLIVGCHYGIEIGGELGGTTTNINVHHNRVEGCHMGIILDVYTAGSSPPSHHGAIFDHNTLTEITGCGIDLLSPTAEGTRVTFNAVSGTGEPLCGDTQAIANTYFEGNSF